MTKQNFFNYNLKEIKDSSNFFVNKTNQETHDIIAKQTSLKNIFLNAPNKSGKSHLVNIWKKNNNAILYNDNFWLTEMLYFLKNIKLQKSPEICNSDDAYKILNLIERIYKDGT